MPPVINKSKCTACGRCAQICCMDVFGPTEPKTVPLVRFPDECWHCRACVMECPRGAVSLRYPLTHTILFRDAPDTLTKEV